MIAKVVKDSAEKRIVKIAQNGLSRWVAIKRALATKFIKFAIRQDCKRGITFMSDRFMKRYLAKRDKAYRKIKPADELSRWGRRRRNAGFNY